MSKKVFTINIPPKTIPYNSHNYTSAIQQYVNSVVAAIVGKELDAGNEYVQPISVIVEVLQ